MTKHRGESPGMVRSLRGLTEVDVEETNAEHSEGTRALMCPFCMPDQYSIRAAKHKKEKP